MREIGGGVKGTLLGSAIVGKTGKNIAIATDATDSAIAGSKFGKKLNQKDLKLQQNSQINALEYNKLYNASTWKNPDTNISGYIKPTNTFTNGEQQN